MYSWFNWWTIIAEWFEFFRLICLVYVLYLEMHVTFDASIYEDTFLFFFFVSLNLCIVREPDIYTKIFHIFYI